MATRLQTLRVFAVLPVTVFALACASPPVAKSPDTPATSSAPVATASAESEPAVFCDLVCEQARVVKRVEDDPDYHARATANANQVLSAMHPDLLACYQKRVAASPAAHGFITVDIVIGADGRVMKVETAGGAILGESTMSCMVRRIEKGAFEPPHGGGTRRIHVPFSLKRMAAGEEA